MALGACSGTTLGSVRDSIHAACQLSQNDTDQSQRLAKAFPGTDRTGQFFCSDLDPAWHKHAPHLLWRHPVGSGWSSFAVVGSYCVTQEQRGEKESVVCYDVLTGTEIWEHGDLARFEEVTGGPGPRTTPTIDGGRIYTLGATGLVNCLDSADGMMIWQRRLSEFVPHGSIPLFGYAGSPLVHAGKVKDEAVSPSRETAARRLLD